MNLGWSDEIKRFIGEKAGMDSLPKSDYGRFIHPGLLPLENRILNHAGKVSS